MSLLLSCIIEWLPVADIPELVFDYCVDEFVLQDIKSGSPSRAITHVLKIRSTDPLRVFKHFANIVHEQTIRLKEGIRCNRLLFQWFSVPNSQYYWCNSNNEYDLVQATELILTRVSKEIGNIRIMYSIIRVRDIISGKFVHKIDYEDNFP